ncbi:tripartite tricarboxylate transporter substrate binding protein [Hahella sp. CR1]|uniref:tripartite tricarboxylate transporter substrate binding protein n=1 Tax=unclassified Hahella TaxID=2624107 RepID=UPI0024421C53|nr:tripartite tricarboxylate transporter substrate-binding protein [Hahella sp. CR1]MDG9669798.1 tripartite tricarboxylate transporter substrate-binding protein [Hahella sp. CR1]
MPIFFRNVKTFLQAAALTLALAPTAHADVQKFLIPAGEGGGWDTTARETGAALTKMGLIGGAKYVNYSGEGGGRALNALATSKDYKDALMVQSLPLILRSLSGVYERSFRDVTPVAMLIAEYQVVVVNKDSPYQNMNDLLAAIKEIGKRKPIVGGSAKGSLDHITALAVLEAANMSSKKLRYSASDGGGDAMRKFSNGYALAMVTGMGEVVKQIKSGELRALGVTSAERLEGFDIPTMKEQGLDVVLANWRGFFVAPGTPDKTVTKYADMLAALDKSPDWKTVRLKYGWESLYIPTQDARGFLEEQEVTIRRLLNSI